MSDSIAAYESNAARYLKIRDKSLVGTKVVQTWAESLEKNSNVLELACGGGYPITRVLAACEIRLRAVDASTSLVEVFRSRFPNIPIQCAPVQTSDFFNQSFDAIIAIGLLFLLNETDQLKLISNVAKSINPGGRFLFTAPLEIGHWEDINTGHGCYSLGREAYETHLNKLGFVVLENPIDVGQNNYYDTVFSPFN